MKRNKKLIIHSDTEKGVDEQVFSLNIEYSSPYLAGSLNTILPSSEEQNSSKHKLIESNFYENSHFNNNGFSRISLDIGNEGLFYLLLRPGHCLDKLDLEPDNIAVDVFYSMDYNSKSKKYDKPNNKLLYSFLNMSDQNVITIRAKLIRDTENIYETLRSNTDDPMWRKYFIKRAISSITDFFKAENSKTSTTRSTPTREVLTAAEAADYLRIKVKTLQNLASQGVIPKLRGGKFRKNELDAYLENPDKKKKKK